MNTLLASSFSLPGQQSKYIGKVREVISLENDLIGYDSYRQAFGI